MGDYFDEDDEAGQWLREHDPDHPKSDRKRAQTRREHMMDPTGESLVFATWDEFDTDDVPPMGEAALEALEQLPEREQMIINMRVFQQATYQQIAEALGYRDRKQGERAYLKAMMALREVTFTPAVTDEAPSEGLSGAA